MITTFPVTVCGLLATPTHEYQGWQTGFYQLHLTGEVSPIVACGQVEELLKEEGLALAGNSTGFLLCTLHHGHDVERAARIGYADQDVDEDEEMGLWPEAGTWTVCGMLGDGQCYSGLWVAHGPRMAYAVAWHHYQRDGRELLVACVHPGVTGRAVESPVWADPVCQSGEEMRARLDELIPHRRLP